MKASPVTLVRRLIAYGIDWYLATMLAGIPLLLVNSIENASTAIDTSIPDGTGGILWGTVAILLGLFYYWMIPVLWDGMTPGKKLMHLRIVSVKNGEKPSVGALLLRQGLGVLLIEGAIAFPSTLMREMLARLVGASAVSVLQTVMVVLTLISVSIGIYTPQKRMIHDYLSGTIEIFEE